MKLNLFTLMFLSMFVTGYSQCHAQCDVVQNGSFTSGWSNWSKQTGWGISTYGGNSTSATNSVDNSPASGYSISQVISNVQGTKVFRLEFDAYAQNPNTGTAYLDFYLDNVKFVRLVNANGSSNVSSILTNGAQSVSTSNWSFSTWKRGYAVDVPWLSNDSVVTLKVTFVSNGSTRDWGVDNIKLCRYQTLDLTEVKYTCQLDSMHFSFTKDKADIVHIFGVDHVTGKAEWIVSTDENQISIPHRYKYYYIKSNNYKKYIGPFELVADERKRTISTKQLLGQYTN
jgi:hypothetical protein